MRLALAIRTAKHVSMINEHGVVKAFAVLTEDGLAIVGMTCGHIEQPGKPEISTVANPQKAVSRKNLEQSTVLSSQEARAEAQP